MAKEHRKIVSAIRVPPSEGVERRTYKEGEEEEFAAVATPEQIDRLAASGAITGDWGQKAVADETEEAAPKRRGRGAK